MAGRLEGQAALAAGGRPHQDDGAHRRVVYVGTHRVQLRVAPDEVDGRAVGPRRVVLAPGRLPRLEAGVEGRGEVGGAEVRQVVQEGRERAGADDLDADGRDHPRRQAWRRR